MESSGVSCTEKESRFMGKLSKFAFLGYDFQHFSFLLDSFRFCFLPNVSKERDWRGNVIKFKESTLKWKLLSQELLRWLSEMKKYLLVNLETNEISYVVTSFVLHCLNYQGW